MDLSELITIVFVMGTVGYIARLVSELNAAMRPDSSDPDG